MECWDLEENTETQCQRVRRPQDTHWTRLLHPIEGMPHIETDQTVVLRSVEGAHAESTGQTVGLVWVRTEEPAPRSEGAEDWVAYAHRECGDLGGQAFAALSCPASHPQRLGDIPQGICCQRQEPE